MVSCATAAEEAATTVCYANAVDWTLLLRPALDDYTDRPDDGVLLPEICMAKQLFFYFTHSVNVEQL